ncbi:hypothetical protein KM043_014142 [Ampulex compressa]|nr:hypothetical protein KM043_014142 [Ampulex compressa]
MRPWEYKVAHKSLSRSNSAQLTKWETDLCDTLYIEASEISGTTSDRCQPLVSLSCWKPVLPRSDIPTKALRVLRGNYTDGNRMTTLSANPFQKIVDLGPCSQSSVHESRLTSLLAQGFEQLSRKRIPSARTPKVERRPHVAKATLVVGRTGGGTRGTVRGTQRGSTIKASPIPKASSNVSRYRQALFRLARAYGPLLYEHPIAVHTYVRTFVQGAAKTYPRP